MTQTLQSAFILLDSIQYSSDQIGFTRAQFQSKLKSKNLPNSPTAITRVLEYIDKNYELKLKFGRNQGCYIIEEESAPNALENFKYYKHLFLRDTFQRLSKEYQLTKDFISFSFDTENRNLEFLPSILKAIQDKNHINFNYQNFYQTTEKPYQIAPLIIKEYLNRWYVLGHSDKHDYQVFSLDRMNDFKISTTRFKSKHKSVKTLFKNTIGVNYNGELITVKIWTDKAQWKYFESLPLHSSQKLVEKTDNGFIFTIDVSHNYELERWLLYYGERIEILEPSTLRSTIKNELSEALNRYN